MKALKTINLPLKGKSRDDILRIVRRVLTISNIQQFVISPKGIDISRDVEEGEPVFDEGSNDISIEALLERLELETIGFAPEEHGTVTLHRASQKLLEMKLVPTWLVAPSWSLLAAWLDVPKSESTPSMVFGFKVVFVDSGTDRMFLLGAESDNNLLTDTKSAVTIDIGV